MFDNVIEFWQIAYIYLPSRNLFQVYKGICENK